MQRFFLVFIFAFCLILKVVNAAGAEAELSGEVLSPLSPAVAQSGETDTFVVADNSENTSNENQDTDVVQVIESKHQEPAKKSGVEISPMLGGSSFSGNWGNHISNSYTLGLGLEIPVGTNTALELEGDYGKYTIAYSNFEHGFDQYTMGLNGKYYLMRGMFQPYLGIGIAAIDYDGMSHGPNYYYSTQRYSQWIGAGQAFAGADVAVSSGVALGARAEYIVPMINRPGTASNGAYSYPYYEESSAIDSTFFRVMGTARLSF